MQANKVLNYNSSAELLIKLIIFIIWPFGAFLASLLNPGSKSSYIIYFLFGVLFSWSMYSVNNGIDFENIVFRFYSQSDMKFSDIIDQLLSLYDENSREKDIYNIFLNWLTRQFSSNFHLLFVFASIPFLYFMLKSLTFITRDRFRFDNSIYCLIIIFLFILPKDLFAIQNFRFGTATWISVYATIQIFYNNKKSSFLWLAVMPLIHASFWLYIGIFISYFFAKHLPLKYIYFVSIPFAIFSFNQFSFDTSFLPPFLSHWADAYTSDEAQEKWGMNKTGSGFYWVADIFNFLKFAAYTTSIIIILKSKELKETTIQTKRTFNFFLFYSAIVNFIQIIPVLGSRFLNNSLILAIFLWYKIMYPNKNYIIKFILASWVFDLLYTKVKHYSYVTDWDFYITNAFSILSKYWNVTNF